MTNGGVAGFPASNGGGPVPDGSITAGKLLAPQAWGKLASGYYYLTGGRGSTSTNGSLGVGTLRVGPWFLPNACTISRIGAEVTNVGDAASKVRLGIYADAGWGYPGNLVLDAGTIAGDSATVQEVTVNQVLSPGLYWVGGAVQVVASVQPTVRVTGGSGFQDMNFAIAAIPTSNQTIGGYQQTSVTGAFPAVFTSTFAYSGQNSVPRVFVKVA